MAEQSAEIELAAAMAQIEHGRKFEMVLSEHAITALIPILQERGQLYAVSPPQNGRQRLRVEALWRWRDELT